MGRLIDANSVYNAIQITTDNFGVAKHVVETNMLDMLAKIPTVDAIPKADYEARFKTGKWIVHRKSDGEVGYFQCTSCDHHSVVKFPYCPICGAEMDCNPNILSEMKAIPKDQYENRLKADMTAMLTELQLEIEEIEIDVPFGFEPVSKTAAFYDGVSASSKVVQQKIDSLKGVEDGNE